MLIDTFPAFLAYWEKSQHSPIDVQIKNWSDEYIQSWPELFSMLVADYLSQDLDWHDIARERIFPYLGERLESMALAHDNLLTLCEPVLQHTEKVLDLTSPVTFVIYVGLGCGAGWAAKYGGMPAVLLGLENIAEEGWTDTATLKGLLSHEISHLAYRHWREQAGKSQDESAWGQLLDEGFAQYCESSLLTQQFHENSTDLSDDWLGWCQRHKAWLAREFLRSAENQEPVNKFFGSWLDIEGHSQTGYFLGHQVISDLVSRGFSIQEIALLDPLEIGKASLTGMLENE